MNKTAKCPVKASSLSVVYLFVKVRKNYRDRNICKVWHELTTIAMQSGNKKWTMTNVKPRVEPVDDEIQLGLSHTHSKTSF